MNEVKNHQSKLPPYERERFTKNWNRAVYRVKKYAKKMNIDLSKIPLVMDTK